jgi:hypothetical protein
MAKQLGAKSLETSLLAEKAKPSKGRMIFRQDNFIIIMPKNYSARLV